MFIKKPWCGVFFMGLLVKILNRWVFPCNNCGKKEKCKQKSLECDNYESKGRYA